MQACCAPVPPTPERLLVACACTAARHWRTSAASPAAPRPRPQPPVPAPSCPPGRPAHQILQELSRVMSSRHAHISGQHRYVGQHLAKIAVCQPTWGNVPYREALLSASPAAAAACARDVTGAGCTPRDRKRCKSNRYGSSSRVNREYAVPDRPAKAQHVHHTRAGGTSRPCVHCRLLISDCYIILVEANLYVGDCICLTSTRCSTSSVHKELGAGREVVVDDIV